MSNLGVNQEVSPSHSGGDATIAQKLRLFVDGTANELGLDNKCRGLLHKFKDVRVQIVPPMTILPHLTATVRCSIAT